MGGRLTLDVYPHVLPDMQREATAALDQMLADGEVKGTQVEVFRAGSRQGWRQTSRSAVRRLWLVSCGEQAAMWGKAALISSPSRSHRSRHRRRRVQATTFDPRHRAIGRRTTAHTPLNDDCVKVRTS